MAPHAEILLIEDNPHDAELTLLSLEECQLKNKVLWVKNGEEALNFIFSEGVYAATSENYLPRIILLDLNIPKISGLDILKKIRSDEKTRNVPVVVMTSSRNDNDIIESYQLGVNGYIIKPVDYFKFTQCIKELGFYRNFFNQRNQLNTITIT